MLRQLDRIHDPRPLPPSERFHFSLTPSLSLSAELVDEPTEMFWLNLARISRERMTVKTERF